MNCAAIQIMPFGQFTAETDSFYQDMREHNKKCTGITQFRAQRPSLVTCNLLLIPSFSHFLWAVFFLCSISCYSLIFFGKRRKNYLKKYPEIIKK